MLLYIITNAILFSFLLTSENIPQEMAQWIIDKQLSVWLFLLGVNILLLVLGCLLLLVVIHPVAEFLHGLAHRLRQLGKPRCAKQQQNNNQDDDELWGPYPRHVHPFGACA